MPTASATAVTQLQLIAGPGRRYGSFAGKTLFVTYLSTTGVFTIIRITERRTAASTDNYQVAADLLGTMIYDIQNGTFNGADYSFTGLADDRAFDLDDTSAYELLRVAATLCGDNPTDKPVVAYGYTVLNPVLEYVMDCQSTNIATVSRILAALLQWKRWNYLRPASITGGRMGAASATGGRMGAASVTGGR